MPKVNILQIGWNHHLDHFDIFNLAILKMCFLLNMAISNCHVNVLEGEGVFVGKDREIDAAGAGYFLLWEFSLPFILFLVL